MEPRLHAVALAHPRRDARLDPLAQRIGLLASGRRPAARSCTNTESVSPYSTSTPSASKASRVQKSVCWPKLVMAFAISGSKKRQPAAPSTPKSAFIMILIAWSAWRSPRCLAAARRSRKRSRISGRIAPSRAKRAPFGATIASASPARAWASGSSAKVRIRLG